MTASRSRTGLLILIAWLLAMVATPVSSASATNGTITVLKAGDRNPADHTAGSYAVGLAGAVFEYSTSESFASIAGTFPATDASGAATKSVAAGTYYVREKTAPSGWTDMGPVQSLYFDPGSSTPDSARAYVSTVVVSSGQTTTTYPDRSSSSEQEAGDSGSPFVDVRDNASFPSYCGTKIQLVLDRSGSISPYKNDYKLAVDAFIDALDNTPTQIGITSFNTDVNTDGISAQSPLPLSTAGNAATLKAKVAAIYDTPQHGTNWDAALRDAATRGGFGPTPESASAKPDMIVFITDGNPTVSPTDSDSGDVSLLDLTYGMASANLVKNQVVAGAVKMKMFALGVGDGVTVENLKVVSGPNDDSSADPDYAATSILALTSKLKEIAGRSCGARIVVRKKLVGADNDALARSNWNFAATSGASVSYSDPDNAAPYKTSGSPAQMTVSVNAIPAGGTNVSVTEDVAGQPLAAGDYGLTGVVCETGQFGSGTTVATTSVTRGFSLGGVALKRNTDLFCTFTNSVLQPNITLTKTTSTPTVNAGDVAKFAVKVQNTGDGPAQNVVVSDVLPAGPTWTADGALPAGCVIANVVVASVTRQKVTCTLASLAKDASVTFNVKATTSAAECSTYDNTVTATAGNQAQIGPDTATVTCVKPPKLIVVKHVVNDDGGTGTAANFTLQVDDPGTDPPSFAGAESPGTPVTVDAGTYSVTEAAQTGYAVTYSADCKNTTIAFGQTKTCTVTNNDIAPSLTVIKHVVNDNGGTKTAADFSLTVDDPGSNPAAFAGAESPGTTVAVDPGAYSVARVRTTVTPCRIRRAAPGRFPSATPRPARSPITTSRRSLTVIKHVVNDNGGTKAAADFSLTIDDPGSNPAAFAGAESPGTTVAVDPGAYSVSEGSHDGYAVSYSAGCTGSLAIGESATCTVTNNDIAPQLTVIKHVVNDSGGTKTAGNFSLTIDDPGSNPAAFAGAESPGTNVTVDPGAYSVSENADSGYVASYSADCASTLAIGQTKTCTVTNNDIAPGLTVIKHVVNDNGGTKAAANFSLTVDDPGSNPAAFAGAESPGTTVAVDPGTYSVSEGDHSGYAVSYSDGCDSTLAIGQTKTCTVTNNDIAPQLNVVKHMINGHGGTKTAADFSLTVDDPGTNPAPFAGAEAPGTAVAVDPGAYTVSEGDHAGYAVSYSADCTGSLAIGETKTCTVTNNDIAPTLTVVKHVVNKGGSSAQASDFTMHVTGNPITPSGFAGAESPGTEKTLAAGPYDVSETGSATADYTQTRSAGCTGTLAIGEAKTCTITNTRRTGSITVRKNLVPADDGGLFDLTVDGAVVREDASDADGATVEVATGTHTVGEAAGSAGALGDYVSSIACNNETSASGHGPHEVSVGSGAELTCTITNTRRANVTIRTVTLPADPGRTTSFGFASSLPQTAGPIAIALGGIFALADLDTVTTSVAPGQHSATENNPAPLGYKLVGLTCTEDKAQNSTVSTGAALPIDRHAALIADPGESIVCTFTNRKVVGQAVVVKAGDTFAYHGDSASYTFAVSNTGNSSLHDVVVTDDKCANVSAVPTGKQNDNGDALLDPLGADATNPEVWVYTCSYSLAAHQTGETNPVVNTATVTGVDELDRPVADTDQHVTTLLHPAISLTKTGPATATAGARVVFADRGEEHRRRRVPGSAGGRHPTLAARRRRC